MYNPRSYLAAIDRRWIEWSREQFLGLMRRRDLGANGMGAPGDIVTPSRNCALLVTAYDVTAYDVTAYDVTAYDVTAYDVTAYDVTAYDLRRTIREGS